MENDWQQNRADVCISTLAARRMLLSGIVAAAVAPADCHRVIDFCFRPEVSDVGEIAVAVGLSSVKSRVAGYHTVLLCGRACCQRHAHRIHGCVCGQQLCRRCDGLGGRERYLHRHNREHARPAGAGDPRAGCNHADALLRKLHIIPHKGRRTSGPCLFDGGLPCRRINGGQRDKSPVPRIFPTFS